MPHKRQYTRRQKFDRNLGTAAKALKVAYSVKKLLNVEMKSFKIQLPIDPNTTGSVDNMTSIAQGDDFNARQGRKILLKSIRCKGIITQHASATQTGVRLLLVRDNLGTTTVPSITDLFATAVTMHDNKNKLGDPQSNARFTVLMDKYWILNGVGNNRVAIDEYIKLNSHCYYTGTAASDEGKGNIYSFMVSTEASNDPVVSMECMTKYIDN